MTEIEQEAHNTLPWRRFLRSPWLLIPAAVMVYSSAVAFLTAIVCEVFSLVPVNLGGVGFTWLTVVAIPSFTAITGVSIANKLDKGEKPNV